MQEKIYSLSNFFTDKYLFYYEYYFKNLVPNSHLILIQFTINKVILVLTFDSFRSRVGHLSFTARSRSLKCKLEFDFCRGCKNTNFYSVHFQATRYYPLRLDKWWCIIGASRCWFIHPDSGDTQTPLCFSFKGTSPIEIR